jgi:calcium-dependent protein kinase
VQIFACKCIDKRLNLPNISPAKQERHLENIQREVAVLKRLRGSLSVVQLEAVYEDDRSVYIIMERCMGGELWRPRGQREHSEATVRRLDLRLVPRDEHVHYVIYHTYIS